jgi:hypothetical protein
MDGLGSVTQKRYNKSKFSPVTNHHTMKANMYAMP